MMFTIRLLLLSLLLAAGTIARADDSKFVADTRDYLQRLEKLGFAGVVVVAKDGAPVIAEGYGLADREKKIVWTPATVSDIGSITKQFTGAAILRLSEEGKLRVEDPLSKYFDGVPEEKAAITLHQLLTHSSGIVDLEGAGDWDPIGRDEFVKRIMAQPLAFEPGTKYEYSNAGYSLLGAIIEKLSAVSYERHLRDRFFMPLAMYETGYIHAGWGDGRLAQGYRDSELWGTTVGRAMAPDGPFWVLRANGGIHMTAWDMLRWTNALLDGRAVSEASRNMLWAPHVREGAGSESFYGYGWSVQEHGGMKVVTHNGGNGVFFADLAVIPGSRTSLFIMTNVASGNRYVGRLLEQIGFRLVAGRPYPDVPRVVATDAARLNALAGEWSVQDGGRLRATASGDALVVQALNPAAVYTLLSTTPQDETARKVVTQRSEHLLAAMRSALADDFAPLARLYATDVTSERLGRAWKTRFADVASQHGKVSRVEVIGAADRGDRQFHLLRVHGERGHQDFAFVWESKASGNLLGITRPLQPVLRFQPEESGAWAAFDGESGESIFLRLEDDRLILGRGDRTVRLKRSR